MDTFIRILSVFIAISVIFVVLSLVFGFFILLAPLLAIALFAIIIYRWVRWYIRHNKKKPHSQSRPKKDDKEDIIIDHHEDE